MASSSTPLRAPEDPRLVELREQVRVGLDQLDRGEGLDGEAVMDELLADFADLPDDE